MIVGEWGIFRKSNKWEVKISEGRVEFGNLFLKIRYKIIGLFAKIQPGEITFRPPSGEHYKLPFFRKSNERFFSCNKLFLTPTFVLCK